MVTYDNNVARATMSEKGEEERIHKTAEKLIMLLVCLSHPFLIDYKAFALSFASPKVCCLYKRDEKRGKKREKLMAAQIIIYSNL